jgi:hypothetical protein
MQTITIPLLDMPSRRYKTIGAIETLVPERHGLRRSNSSGALPAWWSRGSALMNAILYPLAYITSIARHDCCRRNLAIIQREAVASIALANKNNEW